MLKSAPEERVLDHKEVDQANRLKLQEEENRRNEFSEGKKTNILSESEPQFSSYYFNFIEI